MASKSRENKFILHPFNLERGEKSKFHVIRLTQSWNLNFIGVEQFFKMLMFFKFGKFEKKKSVKFCGIAMQDEEIYEKKCRYVLNAGHFLGTNFLFNAT